MAQNFGCNLSIRKNVIFGLHSLKRNKIFYSEDGGKRFINPYPSNVENIVSS
jgi:hypothetical protein